MYKTIVLDCQSLNGEISCSDCIAYRNCTLSRQKGSGSVDKALALC